MTKHSTLPYGQHSIDNSDVEAVASQLRSGWLTQGPCAREFEEELARFCGARFAVVVSSGTAALHLSTLAAGVGQGDFGITSANTFVSSANCIAYAAGQPAFADIEPDTGLIAVDDLRRRCSKISQSGARVKVIVPVDFAGQPAHLAAIRKVADEVGAVVIEDAAHAFGATYTSEEGEVSAGSCVHSDMAIFSFHPVKHITTAEGGAVLTNEPDLYKRVLQLRTHGITKDQQLLTRKEGPWYYEQHSLGFNYRLSDLQCALGLSQLRRAQTFVDRRRELAANYDRAFSEEPFRNRIVPLHVHPGRSSSYHLYVVQVKLPAGETVRMVGGIRKYLFEYLVRHGIQPQVHYIPVTRQPWYEKTFNIERDDYPNAETYYEGCLTIPLFPAMADADQRRVVEVLGEALESLQGSK